MINLVAAQALDPTYVRSRELLARSGSYARTAPAHIDDAEADPATRALWQVYPSVLRQDYSTIEAMTLAGAMVCGQGAVVTAARELVLESVAEFTANGRAPDGLVADGTPGIDGRFTLARPVTYHVDRPCLLVKRPWYRSYSHWLVDAAPILAITANRCRSLGISIVVGQCEDIAMRKIVADLVGRLAPGVEVLEHPDDEIWAFDALTYITPVHVPPLFKLPSGLAGLRDGMLGADSATSGCRERRLFVSRNSFVTMPRTLLNEDDIFAQCAPHGFDRIRPEQMSVIEQAKSFGAAAIVIGVKSDGLANIAFCPAGAAVLTLAPGDFPDPFFWDIAGQLGLSYAELFGRIPAVTRSVQGQNDFLIDPERFRLRLAALLASDAERRP